MCVQRSSENRKCLWLIENPNRWLEMLGEIILQITDYIIDLLFVSSKNPHKLVPPSNICRIYLFLQYPMKPFQGWRWTLLSFRNVRLWYKSLVWYFLKLLISGILRAIECVFSFKFYFWIFIKILYRIWSFSF